MCCVFYVDTENWQSYLRCVVIGKYTNIWVEKLTNHQVQENITTKETNFLKYFFKNNDGFHNVVKSWDKKKY